jgi:L-aminopeptidase/D-esterase-like protein
VLAKLEDANRTEPVLMNPKTGIRKDSILKLHIVDATNLNKSESYHVQAQQDIAKESTSDLSGVGPIWNEAIVFDIRDNLKPLVVTLLDRRDRKILTYSIDL